MSAAQLGARIKQARLAADLSVREGAEAMATSPSHLQRLEGGTTSLPGPSTLHRAAHAFAADRSEGTALYLELMQLAGYLGGE